MKEPKRGRFPDSTRSRSPGRVGFLPPFLTAGGAFLVVLSLVSGGSGMRRKPVHVRLGTEKYEALISGTSRSIRSFAHTAASWAADLLTVDKPKLAKDIRRASDSHAGNLRQTPPKPSPIPRPSGTERSQWSTHTKASEPSSGGLEYDPVGVLERAGFDRGYVQELQAVLDRGEVSPADALHLITRTERMLRESPPRPTGLFRKKN